jgi:hypothetical protein
MGFIVENVVTFISAAAYCCHSSLQMCPQLIQTLEKISVFSWECFHANSVFLFWGGGGGGEFYTFLEKKNQATGTQNIYIFKSQKISDFEKIIKFCHIFTIGSSR